MPIVIPSGGPGGGSGISHSAQDVINSVSQDLRLQLASTGGGGTILLDYCNRISLEILRSSKWQFLLSDPQTFITRTQITDYWIGATGSNPAGSVDTGLNLTNIYRIKDDTVVDRSNTITLGRTYFQPPNMTTFEYPDGQSRPLRPTNFYHKNYSGLLRLFPAADNANTYQPIPENPVCTTTVSGSLAARTYTVRLTLVDSAGLESSASGNPTTIFIPANSVMVVNPPKFPAVASAFGVQYNKYKVYAVAKGGIETLQSGALSSSTVFTEPNTGLVNGAPFPTVNNITALNGYAIEFQYWQQRINITAGGQLLQIPDDYFDVVVAGVNYLGFQFLEEPTQMKMWLEIYQQGLREIIRDKNQFGDDNFMRPDTAITQAFPPGIIPGFITGL